LLCKFEVLESSVTFRVEVLFVFDPVEEDRIHLDIAPGPWGSR